MRRVAVILIVALLLIPGVAANAFTDGVIVHPSNDPQEGSLIISSETMGAHVIWYEAESIWVSSTTDCETFSEPSLVSGSVLSLPMADSDEVMAITWVNLSDNSLMLALSEDGQDFDIVRLMNGTIGSHAIACDGRDVYVVAVVDDVPLWGIYEPNGTVWDRFTDDPVRFPSIDASGGSVVIAWHSMTEYGNRIAVREVSDEGSSVMWVPCPTRSTDVYADVSIGNTTVVAFERRQDDSSSVHASVKGDASMSDPIAVSDASWAFAGRPSIDVTDGSVEVVFDGRSGGSSFAVYTYLVDGRFSAGIEVDSKLMDSEVSMCTVDGMPAVAYRSEASPHCIEVSVMEDRPPTCTILSPAQWDECSANLTVSGTSEDPTEVGLWTEVRMVSEAHSTSWVNASGGDDWEVTFDTSHMPNGTYRIEAVSHDASYHSETASVDVSVSNDVVMLPDLMIQGMSASPIEVLPGESVNVSVTFSNHGPVAAYDVAYRVSIDGSVELSGRFEMMEPYESLTVSSEVGLDFGAHTIRADIDPDGEVLQSDTSDDTSSELVSIARRWVPAWVNVTTTIEDCTGASEVVNVTVTVESDCVDPLDGTISIAVDGTNESSMAATLAQGTNAIVVPWTAIEGNHTISATLMVDDGIHVLEGSTSASTEVDVPYPEGDTGGSDLTIVLILTVTVIAIAIVVWRVRR